jgi:hypothetical protein
MESLKEFWDEYKDYVFGLGGILLVVLGYKLLTLGLAFIESIGK